MERLTSETLEPPINGVNPALKTHGQHRLTHKKTVLAMNQEPFPKAARLLLCGTVALFLLLQSPQSIASELDVGIRSPSLGTNDYSDIVHRDRQWTIVGNQGTILNSPDGIHWTQTKSGTKLGIRSLAFSSDLWIAVGDQGLILASRDRENWTLISSPTINHLNEVTYAFGQWMAVGNRGTIPATAKANRYLPVDITHSRSRMVIPRTPHIQSIGMDLNQRHVPTRYRFRREFF